MTVKTVAHLNFRGTARAALTFYHAVFGGTLAAISYADAGAASAPAEADQLMWGEVRSASGFAVMAYDVPSHLSHDPGEIPFFVSVRGDSADEIVGYWEKLAADATILQPLGPAGWSPLYGMLKDRFGISWVLDVEAAAAAA